MADNGKLQFFGQTVYPQTLSTNILNPDGTPAPVLPVPSSANAGQVPVVNAAGNGYELQAQSSGGITQSTVIERPESLPTATADSPDFVQTPDGTLYRKKAVESGGLLGTWVFNDIIEFPPSLDYIISFTSNGRSYETISRRVQLPTDILLYDSVTVYEGAWTNTAYKTIQITDISSLTNEAEFTSWLTANATKQGGGASVSYEYVAQQDVPTPTTADNGKVLGVVDGAYALQGVSAQKKLYTHYYHILAGEEAFYPVFIFDFGELFTDIADLLSYLNNKYTGIVTCFINGSANLGDATEHNISEIYAEGGTQLRIRVIESTKQYPMNHLSASLITGNCKVYEL